MNQSETVDIERPSGVPIELLRTGIAVLEFIAKSSPEWVVNKEALLVGIINKLVYGGISYRLDSNRNIVSAIIYGIAGFNKTEITREELNESFWSPLKEDGNCLIVDKMDGLGFDASSMLSDVLNNNKNISHVIFINRKENIIVLKKSDAFRRIRLMRLFSSQKYQLN